MTLFGPHMPINPIENVERLMAVADQSNKQLSEAVAIIKNRDRQIFAALEGLDKVLKYNPGCTHKGDSRACNYHAAKWAIEKMREIHRELGQ